MSDKGINPKDIEKRTTYNETEKNLLRRLRNRVAARRHRLKKQIRYAELVKKCEDLERKYTTMHDKVEDTVIKSYIILAQNPTLDDLRDFIIQMQDSLANFQRL